MQLPTRQQVLQAVDIYLKHAYDGVAPESIQPLLPGPNVDPAAWMVCEGAECDPPGATLETLRSAAFRLGNFAYPHMKLRVSRPPNKAVFLFSVDSHDAILQAKPGTSDYAMLEELKANNATISKAVLDEWDAVNLPTERNFLRGFVERTRKAQDDVG